MLAHRHIDSVAARAGPLRLQSMRVRSVVRAAGPRYNGQARPSGTDRGPQPVVSRRQGLQTPRRAATRRRLRTRRVSPAESVSARGGWGSGRRVCRSYRFRMAHGHVPGAEPARGGSRFAGAGRCCYPEDARVPTRAAPSGQQRGRGQRDHVAGGVRRDRTGTPHDGVGAAVGRGSRVPAGEAQGPFRPLHVRFTLHNVHYRSWGYVSSDAI